MPMHPIRTDSGVITSQSSGSNVLYRGSSPLSFEQYANMSGVSGNPYSFGNKILNFFTGNVSSAEQAYKNYLADYEYKRNKEATAKANLETWQREDTATQRAVADAEAAGLSPYALLNVGGMSQAVTSAAQAPSYKRGNETKKDKSNVVGTALKLLAILALKG